MAQTHYQVLGLTPSASQDEIKQAYRELAKVYHPDKGGSNQAFHEEKFKQINEAYQTLSDPHKKAIYDLKLMSYPRYRPRKVKYRRRTARYHSNRATSYSKKAYMFGFLFVVGLVFIVGYSTYYMINHQSKRDYQQGLYFYEQGQYAYAVVKLMNASRDFGSSSVDACILAAKILLYDLEHYEEALGFIEKGLGMADEEADKAQLYYYKATYYKFQKYYDNAYMAYQTTVEIDPAFDSAYYQLGELDAFLFKRYENAIEHFNKLLEVNEGQFEGYLGRGFCEQKLGQDSLAVLDFGKYITFNNTEGMAFYLKAVSEINLKDTLGACNDLSMAMILGVEESDELMEKVCNVEKEDTEKSD